jgi:hypothetical protein
MTTGNQRSGIHVLFMIVALTTTPACRDSGPKLTVGRPKQNSHFVKGDTIHFAAELNSNEDPGVVPESEWHWVSDIDGDLGREPRLDTPNLSVGEHQVTVSVHHKLGLSRGRVVVFVDSITAPSSTR